MACMLFSAFDPKMMSKYICSDMIKMMDCSADQIDMVCLSEPVIAAECTPEAHWVTCVDEDDDQLTCVDEDDDQHVDALPGQSNHSDQEASSLDDAAAAAGEQEDYQSKGTCADSSGVDEYELCEQAARALVGSDIFLSMLKNKKTVRDIKAAIQVSVKAIGAKKPISKKTFKKVFAMLADEAEAEASQCSGNTRISHVPFRPSDPNKVNLAPEGLGRNPTGPKTPTASITPTRPVYYCRNTRGHLGGS